MYMVETLNVPDWITFEVLDGYGCNLKCTRLNVPVWRYLMDQLRKLCEAALVSGVRVTRENLFDLARWSWPCQWSLWWMCWWWWWWRPHPGLPESSRACNPQLGHYSPSAQDFWGFSFHCSSLCVLVISSCVCAPRQELPKDFGILSDFDREDFETFQVIFTFHLCILKLFHQGHICVCIILSFEWVICFPFL